MAKGGRFKEHKKVYMNRYGYDNSQFLNSALKTSHGFLNDLLMTSNPSIW